MTARSIRNLLIVLGDQLDPGAALFRNLDPEGVEIFMAEVREESTHVFSSKTRIAFFLSAMRHFAEGIRQRGFRITYIRLDDPLNTGTLEGELARYLDRVSPDRVLVTAPGEHRVLMVLRKLAAERDLALEIVPDEHFLTRVSDFRQHASGRRQLRLEYWYREVRSRFGILMEDGRPLGDRWNFDQDNRKSFGKRGPPSLVSPRAFPPDGLTREVLNLVEHQFKDHPGSLEAFDWPVTPEDARLALHDFVQCRLPVFGAFQDAMWLGEPWLFHARISAAMNLKLLSVREVVEACENAFRDGQVPLSSAEGFIRQIVGWREYVRGVYWTSMPGYLDQNGLGHAHALPEVYWTGNSELSCLREAVSQTLKLGYAHHIQRLMVLGLHALLVGVRPFEVHRWFLAVFIDAVEWVEAPNVMGMSQYADSGRMASKPYVASGRYIQKMSNYCAHCRFDPGSALGEKACPITTLYWEFLSRHRDLLKENPRMSLSLTHLERFDADTLAQIHQKADIYRSSFSL